MTVFEGDGLSIHFSCSAVPGQPGSTDITATATNSGLDDVTDFNLQVNDSAGK